MAKLDMEGSHSSRRAFVASSMAAMAALLEGCTALRVVFTPAKFSRDGDLIDRRLRAFAATVIPGAPLDDPGLVRIFSDPAFPFFELRAFFLSDLSDRSAIIGGSEEFETLELPDRTRVVQNGLGCDDAEIRRLYQGAIFAAQVSFFGGIYGPGGCSLIDVPGPNPGFPRELLYHAEATGHLAPELTRDGNLQ